MSWTDERVEQLKELHKEGLSCSQIARALGGVTRNAVIGKLTRMGLGNTGLPRPAQVRQRTAPNPNPVKPPQVERPPAAHEFSEEFAQTMDDSTDDRCRWPFGDPGDAGFRYCGRARASRKTVYCEGHQAKGVQPTAGIPRRVITKRRWEL